MNSAYQMPAGFILPNGTMASRIHQQRPLKPLEDNNVVLERQDFHIRLTSGADGSRSNVSMLIERMYAWKGLSFNPKSRTTVPNEITLAVYRGPILFGTLTLGLDSPGGLLVDDLYDDVLMEHRSRGAKVCEITKLAIDPRFNSKKAIAAIFNLAYIFARKIHCMTDVFVEVNPRHTAFYQRMLHFTEIREERFCERVSAPARLLHLPLAEMDNFVTKYGGGANSGDRSLYSYFFSPEEQAGIIARIHNNNLVAADC